MCIIVSRHEAKASFSLHNVFFLESFGTRILHGFAVDFESTCTGTTPL